MTEPQQPQFGRIIVADYLPAGFRDRQSSSCVIRENQPAAWIEDTQDPVNTEFRDDRFSAGLRRQPDDAPVFTVAYVLRAVSPDARAHPQAHVEDMYHPNRFWPHRDCNRRCDGGALRVYEMSDVSAEEKAVASFR